MATVALVTVLAVLGATPALAMPPSGPVSVYVDGALVQTSEVIFSLDGLGVGQRIGGFSYHGEVVITGVDESGTITDTLTETLTMPNGDTLTILCQQVAVEVAPGVLAGTDEWTVIGGTGRYAGATGSGSGTTVADLNMGTFTKVFDGAITR
ncbi:MAG: hypothetical protein OEM97_08750 [Acidimicrobiia bacterium]|nr:hypothetical protein [Acidimicrobiia bacterium]